MLRQGFTIKIDDEQLKRDDFFEVLREVLIKSRICGAACIHVGVNDGLLQEQRLTIERVKGIYIF